MRNIAEGSRLFPVVGVVAAPGSPGFPNWWASPADAGRVLSGSASLRSLRDSPSATLSPPDAKKATSKDHANEDVVMALARSVAWEIPTRWSHPWDDFAGGSAARVMGAQESATRNMAGLVQKPAAA